MSQPEEEKEKKIEGVIFLQHTKNSELARNIRKRLQDIEKVTKVRIKLVERTGSKIVDILHKSDAWSGEDCFRDDCWPCASAGEEGVKSSCKRRSVLYETYCETCEDESDSHIKKNEEKEENLNGENIESENKRKRNIEKEERKDEKSLKLKRQNRDYRVKYLGDTWRTAYERGLEHKEDLEHLREGSHLLKHILEEHPNKKIDEVKFGMRVKLRFKTALERHVSEAVEIQQAQLKGYNLLNSKSEYSRCTLPRMKMENNKELLERLIEEREKEKKMKENIRNLKKRRKDPMVLICEEIEAQNGVRWKKRKLNEEINRRNRELEEKREWEKQKRLEKAKRKKEELLERTRRKNNIKIVKNI